VTEPVRHAVYFAPPQASSWGRFGQQWLDGAWRPPAIDAARWQSLLRAPRRYGFHATLKAPFRLAPGCTPEALAQRIDALAAQCRAVPLGALVPRAFDGYVALVPEAPPPALQALAERCVLELDDLRAPLTPSERAHRRPERQDERARALLEAHGYPQVLERFRFHMTLAMTERDGDADEVLACASAALAEVQRDASMVLDRLCLCVEPGPGQDFVRVRDAVLTA
jgi:2'-5' RNA ligase